MKEENVLKKRTALLSLLFVFVLCISGYAVEDESTIKVDQLNYEGAVRSVEKALDLIHSFRDLTNLIERKCRFRRNLNFSTKAKSYQNKFTVTLTADELRKIGNLDWVTQTIGGENYMNQLEGTLVNQKSIISSLKYEILKLKKASEDELKAAEEEAEIDKQTLDEFISKRHWID